MTERMIPYPSGLGKEASRRGWQRPKKFDRFLEINGYLEHDIDPKDKRVLESFYRWRHLVQAGIFGPSQVAEKLEKRVSRVFKENEQEVDQFYDRNLEIINFIAQQTTPLTNNKPR